MICSVGRPRASQYILTLTDGQGEMHCNIVWLFLVNRMRTTSDANERKRTPANIYVARLAANVKLLAASTNQNIESRTPACCLLWLCCRCCCVNVRANVAVCVYIRRARLYVDVFLYKKHAMQSVADGHHRRCCCCCFLCRIWMLLFECQLLHTAKATMTTRGRAEMEDGGDHFTGLFRTIRGRWDFPSFSSFFFFLLSVYALHTQKPKYAGRAILKGNDSFFSTTLFFWCQKSGKHAL